MKKTVIILGLTSAIAAAIFSVTKFYNQAIIPIIIAFVSGLIILLLSKKEQTKTKSIQYIFLLVIISLGLTIYKNVSNTPEMESIEQLEENAQNSDDSDEIMDTTEVD